jgi:AraC-like DNA-binding protein
MRHGHLGAIRIVEVTSDAARVVGSRVHTADSLDPDFLVHVQLKGQSTISQAGREITLSPGGFTLCNGGLERYVHFDERVTMLIVCIPSNLLRRRISFPEVISVCDLSATRGSSDITVSCLRSIWDGCADIAPGVASRFADIVVDLLAAALASHPDTLQVRSATLTKSRIQIIDYIEARLTDSALTSASVAHRFSISSRHLYSVFGEAEGVAKYILRRRLEQSARILADPLHHARRVNMIAYDHGFSSPARYCTAFRRQYGLTPSEYRIKIRGTGHDARRGSPRNGE